MIDLREDLELAIEADDRERLDAIVARGDPDDFDALRRFVRDGDTPPTLRRRAIYALGAWPNREAEAVDTIEAVLPRLDELERITAVSTLGRIGTPRAREIVVDFRDDDATDVRRQVVTALARVDDEPARKGLREMAESDDSEQVRENAREQVSRMEDR